MSGGALSGKFEGIPATDSLSLPNSQAAAVMLSEASWIPEWEHREFFGEVLHLFAVPVLATGYVSALVVAFEGGRGRALLTPFAAVGRMALTNYLMQSLVIGFVLLGIGPGLALAGKIGTAAVTGIVVAFFALQILVSRWWLRHFAYGPVEWVWRALTYGSMPPMRLSQVKGEAGG